MPRSPKEPKEVSGGITPEKFPEIPPSQSHSSGDYSYTLEVVMGRRKTLSELTQAVRTLSDQVKEQGAKIDSSCADIHAAKVVVRVLLGIVVAAATFAGFVAKAALDYLAQNSSEIEPVLDENLARSGRK